MLLDVPLAIWVGIVAMAFVILTFMFGLERKRLGQRWFRYHRYLAYASIVLLLVHAVLAFMLWFMGIVI